MRIAAATAAHGCHVTTPLQDVQTRLPLYLQAPSQVQPRSSLPPLHASLNRPDSERAKCGSSRNVDSSRVFARKSLPTRRAGRTLNCVCHTTPARDAECCVACHVTDDVFPRAVLHAWSDTSRSTLLRTWQVKSFLCLPLPLLPHRDCKRLRPWVQAAEQSRLWELRYESQVKQLAQGASECARV
jgi:hypothetical protein